MLVIFEGVVVWWVEDIYGDCNVGGIVKVCFINNG